jgi:hypothetical protein
MKKIKVDRSNWKPGPWDNEPDEEHFYHNRVPCVILRNYSGALCGYAGVYKNHPYHGDDYDNHHLDVHGGLTFSGDLKNLVGEPGVWYFGFDCAHGFDLVPGLDAIFHESNGTYRGIDYVRKETKKLADQLLKALGKPSSVLGKT